MKATELMIGDWVRIYYVNKLGKKVDKVFQVGQIRDVCGDLCVWAIPTETTRGNMGALEPKYGESYIIPITLTSEILEKNGFERFGTDYILSGKRFGLSNPSTPNNYKDNYWLKVSTRAVKIKYVHELQHALLICELKRRLYYEN